MCQAEKRAHCALIRYKANGCGGTEWYEIPDNEIQQFTSIVDDAIKEVKKSESNISIILVIAILNGLILCLILYVVFNAIKLYIT